MNRTITLLLLTAALASYSQDFSTFKYRNLGPYRGGRVTAVAGIASEPATFYLGATGAGVWKTEDYGTTWRNVSDGFFSTPSIGALEVAQNDPNIIYVGTGSDGLRSNVIEGKGVYKSIDAGETWMHVGLENVGQIGAVRIHPTNHNIVYVASVGKAFNANPERGIFKTEDGGKTWKKILYVSEKTGFSDIEFLSSNPEVLFASAWKAERKPWTIISGGSPEEGGVYKSIDGGKTWNQVNKGLPNNLIGKIDVAVTPADSKIVYALIEAPNDEGGLFKSVDQGESFELVSNKDFIRTRPFYYNNIRVDPKNADIVYSLATRYYKSIDGGKNWERMNPPHGDNHDMWINPDNPDLFIQANDGGANVTHNGGKTWSTQFNQPTAEIYQVEVDDQYPYWVYGGQQDNYTTIAVPSLTPYGNQVGGTGYILNTGGCETGPAVPKPGNPDIVYSNCKGRFGVFNKNTGTEMQFYVGASNMYGHNPKELKYRFQRVSPIHVSPHNPDVVYHCSQYVHKTTDDGKTWETISPDLTAFEEDKQVISGSPITRDITGEEFYSTIYSIQESPISEGLIWVGANDGPVHVTKDGGKTWTNVTPAKLPSGGRVDAVAPSPHDPAKAYISVLRYQLGDQKPYIYKTANYGKSWELLTTGTNGIPADYPTRVIREDPERAGLLYAGTEYGIFISFDDGKNWKSFQQNLPITPITDLKIHRNDLVMATMGRGFWVVDNIESLRNENFTEISENTLFKPANTIRYRYPTANRGDAMPNYPAQTVAIDYFLEEKTDAIKLEIKDVDGNIIAIFVSDTTKSEVKDEIIENMDLSATTYIINKSLTTNQGMNRFEWDMSMTGPWHSQNNRRFKGGPLAKPGKYDVVLTVEGRSYTNSFELIIDPRVKENGVSESDISSQVDFQMKVGNLLSDARKMENELADEVKKLKSNESLSEEEQTTLNNSKTKLEQLRTEEGIYMKPMLVDQISYLYFMLNRADQVPGKDAFDRYEELKGVLEKLKE
ncbi:WD40/YVTN/BNR-like repeat-containing protein [Ekhidna sp.]|uniref:WD40/YVTN/BNR-like repeat-containing protein n=1 Tax=Ekhidna sp. TaxID=2608089 RepID=UPI003BAB0351